MRIEADKIASVTRRLQLGRALTLSARIECRPGAVIAGRVLNDKHGYNFLEDVYGRMNEVASGDLVVGALGHRNALHGYEGVMPERVEPGQRLHLLNLGGVIGECVSYNAAVGPPFELQVLGQVLHYPDFGRRHGVPANISDVALAAAPELPACPVVYVTGTCMNSGKTMAGGTLVKHFRRTGLKVAGVKLTGVSLLRDVLAMRDQGAVWVMDFTDAGAVCTGPENAADLAHVMFRVAARERPDVIVAETGDGIMGEYGVQAILADGALRALAGAMVFCANDPVGAAGGVQFLREAFGITPDVITGPVTDNRVGARFIGDTLAIAAINARTQPEELAAEVLAKLARRSAA